MLFDPMGLNFHSENQWTLGLAAKAVHCVVGLILCKQLCLNMFSFCMVAEPS